MTLGNTQYNVQISRFLNPTDPEDEGKTYDVLA